MLNISARYKGERSHIDTIHFPEKKEKIANKGGGADEPLFVTNSGTRPKKSSIINEV